MGSRLEGYLEAFKEMDGDCHLCQTTHGDSDRVILKTRILDVLQYRKPSEKLSYSVSSD